MNNTVFAFIREILKEDADTNDFEYYARRDPDMSWGSAGAGILFTCEDGDALFLRRSGKCAEPYSWGIPGGSVDEGWHKKPIKKKKPPAKEFLQAALRETREECGSLPPNFSASQVQEKTVFEDRGFVYVTFIAKLRSEQKKAWKPVSNDGETLEFLWSSLSKARTENNIDGNPLHTGVAFTLSKFS